MFHKQSIRLRLTILSACLLTLCCVGLTMVMNVSAFQMIDTVDAAIITTPAIDLMPAQTIAPIPQDSIPMIPLENVQKAKKGFSIQSILYMVLVILGGSALTYYISGRALKPLDLLNEQVKNLNVHNLSKTLKVPPTKDEIADLTVSFNHMSDKLNDAFLMQQRFSANAAHELRSPLAILQTKLDVFQKKPVHTNVEYDAILQVFAKQTSRLRGLVDSLLNLTNMNDEREFSIIEVKDIMEDICAQLENIAATKNITLSMTCDNSTVIGNLDLLYQAFYNLIENAIKYNVAFGSVTINVKKQSDDLVYIIIEDSGIGIPNDMKSLIFEPFYRVDKSRSREMGGAGLGLSIVNSIIKKHGGNVQVSDRMPNGSCFTITL